MTSQFTKPSTNRILLAFYGDDFTGSTDSMEALTLGGLDTVLFLEPPDESMLAEQFPEIQCYGIAGVSRSMSPQDMERELRPIFEQMKSIPSKLVHYKICSTFDSSPEVGSIGCAIRVGREVFGNQTIPLLVGAPVLKRYTLFGNHFATVKGDTYRLDRHPTMSKHPITPMHEADLRKHLQNQTKDKIGLMDILELDRELDEVQQLYDKKLKEYEIILFDVLDERRLTLAGHLIWHHSTGEHQFVVGSSGVEYALTSLWREEGLVKDTTFRLNSPGDAGQILVLSGSCSPVTQGQIEYAGRNGFKALRVPVEELLDPDMESDVQRDLIQDALNILREGYSLILYTALGPDDGGVQNVRLALESKGMATGSTGEFIGKKLGQFARELIWQTDLRRIVVAGGDTCGYASRELNIFALKVFSPIAPGSPLCTAFSGDPKIDGLQIALKGGQVGREDYFIRVLRGSVPEVQTTN